jgi:hypothetical protein
LFVCVCFGFLLKGGGIFLFSSIILLHFFLKKKVRKNYKKMEKDSCS